MAKSVEEQIKETERKLKLLKKRNAEKKLHDDINDLKNKQEIIQNKLIELKKNITTTSFKVQLTNGENADCIQIEKVISCINSLPFNQ